MRVEETRGSDCVTSVASGAVTAALNKIPLLAAFAHASVPSSPTPFSHQRKAFHLHSQTTAKQQGLVFANRGGPGPSHGTSRAG